ncbi:YbdK family carboxylate-amine ligase [Gulosibacter sp. 10]|uniref:carboxylate-amine ligase n=1 Tax=Gulosibacter sp. 10 TaxID=1255570 RepID=UPI00097E799B|nr:YbdK family carboxylate-amine ligase [Gulosibacter sp. 10]SJM62776.1 hypothetical protein FM112_08755 [Gulosibacter sp. 10]
MSGRERRSFGVEEEYLLLDAVTGRPSDHAEPLIRSLPEQRERADREFFSSQLETATPVCVDAAEAEEALTGFRRAVSEEAARRGVVLAGTGLPPVGGEEAGTVTPKKRYRAIEAEVRNAGAYQYVTGTHVHVEVPSRDAGVDALQRLARWAPTLLALSANSPIWLGEPTGFASWRHIKSMTWPIAGYPPAFADGDEYDRAIGQLVASGVLLDSGIVTWVARLSDNFPTIELRIADAHLEARDAAAFGVLVRAIVDQGLREAEEGVAAPGIVPGLLDGALWLAARDGLEAELVDPAAGESRPAFEAVDLLLESVAPTLAAYGDLERVEGYADRLRRGGSQAAQQLRRYEEDGVAGLLDLYRTGSEREPGEARDRPAATAV